MADVIYFDDGSCEVVPPEASNKFALAVAFFGRIVYDRLGTDAAKYYKGIMEEAIGDSAYIGDNYEVIADGYRAYCVDAMQDFEEILHMLDAKRLDRKQLKRAATQGWKRLHDNL